MKRYVIGRIKIKPGKRDEYLAHAANYIATTRGEPGCLYFEEGRSTQDPDDIVIAECWDTPEAHAAHTKAPHFAAFGPIFERYVLHAHFEEMNVGEVNDVVVDFK